MNTYKHNVVLLFVLSIVFQFLIVSCREKTSFHFKNTSKVNFIKQTWGWQLLRNGKPYYIKGAYGFENLELVKATGGNSIVVYDKDLSDSLLNLADSLGLSVTVNLEIAKARFVESRYDDEQFVLQQRKRIEAIVRKYYTHPAILFWIIGNEVHLMKKNNIRVWQEINNLAKLIHSIDPYHPTSTSIAAYPTQSYQTLQMKLFAPELDFVSLNVYDFAPILRRELNSFVWGIDGPFLISEWAGEPFWVSPITEWGVFIEKSSTQNAGIYYTNYCTIFGLNKDRCIGGYVFYWGQKQERTHTVFSLIHDGKYKTQAVENLQMLWSGKEPQNWCPRIKWFYFDGFGKRSNIMRDTSQYVALVSASDPDGDSMKISWDIRPEGAYIGKVGGQHEKSTAVLSKSDTLTAYTDTIRIVTPKKEGPYRLFVYVYDNHNYVATANIPFYVVSGMPKEKE